MRGGGGGARAYGPVKITCGHIMKRLVHLACFTNVPVVSYAIPKKDEVDNEDGGEILGGTGYGGRWGRVILFSKSTPSCGTYTPQNCSLF